MSSQRRGSWHQTSQKRGGGRAPLALRDTSGPVPRGDPCLYGQRKSPSWGQSDRRCSCRGVCSGTRAHGERDHRVRHAIRPVRGTVGGRRNPLAGGGPVGGWGGGGTRMGSMELPAPAADFLATLPRARRDTRRSECQSPRLSSSSSGVALLRAVPLLLVRLLSAPIAAALILLAPPRLLLRLRL